MLEENPPLSERLVVEEFTQALATALRRLLAHETPDVASAKLEPEPKQKQEGG